MNSDEVIQLSEEGKIKHKKKFLKEADDETIERISKEYVAKQLEETNEQVANIIVEKFSDLLEQTDMVENDCGLKEKLSENKLFRNDLRSFVGSVTPYVPYIGLVSGLLTVAGYVVYKKLRSSENENEEDEVTPDKDEDATEDSKDQKDSSEPKETRKRKAPKAPKSSKEPRKREAPKEPKAPQEQKSPKEPKEKV